jgi:hypothetical protein
METVIGALVQEMIIPAHLKKAIETYASGRNEPLP